MAFMKILAILGSALLASGSDSMSMLQTVSNVNSETTSDSGQTLGGLARYAAWDRISGNISQPTKTPPTKTCPKFKDQDNFNCQLYEGAQWCAGEASSKVRMNDEFRSMWYGPGWCNYCLSGKKGGFAPKSNQQTAGGLTQWKDKSTGLDATQACQTCGADCIEREPEYTPLPFPDNCVDHLAPNGNPWTDSWGYSCLAYQHGPFCMQEGNNFVPATPPHGQWSEMFGKTFKGYKWWAAGFEEKVDATQSCCVCGGGKRS